MNSSMMTVDLRSDTVTKPTQGMLEAMFRAEVGDDVMREDPTVAKLEAKAASMLGMEAGLFCPSGTMTNQIAIRILTVPQDEVICDEKSHIHNYEGGGIAYNSFVSTQLIKGKRGKLKAEEIVKFIKPDDVHNPRTRLVALENTVNKGGGSIYTLEEIKPVATLCREKGLRMHLDGARLFNAIVETQDDPAQFGQYFDTISICLSKGLGAPVGSLLLSSTENIKVARRVRKVLGGGMRQAGFLAAAGIYALDHHIDRLSEDHYRAKVLGEMLSGFSWVEQIMPVDSNIIIFTLVPQVDPGSFVQELRHHGILVSRFGGQDIRMVTHLEIDDQKLDCTQKKFREVRF